MKRGFLLALLLIIGLGSVAAWLFGSTSGRAWRLTRMATRDLVAHTMTDSKDLLAQRILGERFLKEGRVEEAVTTSRAASEANPRDLTILTALGRALIQAGRSAEAITVLERALSSSNANIYAALGEADYMLDDRTAAVSHFQTALQTDKANMDALTGLAILKTDMRNFAEARNLIEHLVKVAPDSCHAWTALGYLQDRIGDNEQALQSLSRAVDAGPTDARAWRLLAAAQVRMARSPMEFRRASETLAQADRFNPNLPFLSYQRGLLLAREGRHAEAIVSFQQALERSPHYSDALYNLSLSLAFMGRTEESIKTRALFEHINDYNRERNNLRLRLSRDPNNLEIWKRLKALAEMQQDNATADEARRHVQQLQNTFSVEDGRERVPSVEHHLPF